MVQASTLRTSSQTKQTEEHLHFSTSIWTIWILTFFIRNLSFIRAHTLILSSITFRKWYLRFSVLINQWSVKPVICTAKYSGRANTNCTLLQSVVKCIGTPGISMFFNTWPSEVKVPLYGNRAGKFAPPTSISAMLTERTKGRLSEQLEKGVSY